MARIPDAELARERSQSGVAQVVGRVRSFSILTVLQSFARLMRRNVWNTVKEIKPQ